MNTLNTDFLAISQQIEQLLVRQNLRGMATLKPHLRPGYILRAARLINQCSSTVLIGTGFPVAGTFETDGPVGAIAIYRMLQQLDVQPVLVCGDPLLSVLDGHFQVEAFPLGIDGQQRAAQLLTKYQPAAVLCIERPGQAVDGRYYNMRHEDISAKVADLDALMRLATCPTVGIGDGGNEIGMGKIIDTIRALDIRPAVTSIRKPITIEKCLRNSRS